MWIRLVAEVQSMKSMVLPPGVPVELLPGEIEIDVVRPPLPVAVPPAVRPKGQFDRLHNRKFPGA